MKNFFNLKTIEWKKGKVLLIDQRLLPKKLKFIELKNYREVAYAISNMIVRGAPAIGVAAAMGLALVAYHSKEKKKERLMKELKKASQVLKNTRPTAINLFWAIERVLSKAERASGNIESIKKSIIEEACKIAEEDFITNIKLGEEGSKLLEDGDTVLTHCKWLLRL
jgi:methylthioribose-1-phosphate isomerase